MRNVASCTVAYPQEDQLWRVTKHETALMKIGIFGDNRLSVFPSERPDERVVCLKQAMILDVGRTGVKVEDLRDDPI